MSNLYKVNIGAAICNFGLVFHSYGFQTPDFMRKMLNYSMCQLFILLGLYIATYQKEKKNV